MTSLEYANQMLTIIGKTKKGEDPQLDEIRAQIEELAKEADQMDRLSKGEKIKKTKGDDLIISPTDHLIKDINLRREMNAYLRNNRDIKDSDTYQAVLQSYQQLLGKCAEDEKKYGMAFFDAAIKDEESKLKRDWEKLNPEQKLNGIMKQIYLAELKEEYHEASLNERTITDPERVKEAVEWKNEVMAELFADNLEDRFNQYLEEPLAKEMQGIILNEINQGFKPDWCLKKAVYSLGMDKLEYFTLPEKKEQAVSQKVIGDVDHLHRIGNGLNFNTEMLKLLDTSDIKDSLDIFGPYDDTYNQLKEKIKNDEIKAREDAEDKAMAERHQREIKELNDKINEAKTRKEKAEADRDKFDKSAAKMLEGGGILVGNNNIDSVIFAEKDNSKVDQEMLKTVKQMLSMHRRNVETAESDINTLTYQLGQVQLRQEREKEEVKTRRENERKIQELAEKGKQAETDVNLSIGDAWKEKRVQQGLFIRKENIDKNKSEHETGYKTYSYERIPFSNISANQVTDMLGLSREGKITDQEFGRLLQANQKNLKRDTLIYGRVEAPRRERKGLLTETGVNILHGIPVAGNKIENENAKVEENKNEINNNVININKIDDMDVRIEDVDDIEAEEKEVQKNEAPNNEILNNEAPKNEVPQNEAPKNEVPIVEAPKVEPPKNEVPQNDVPKNEPPKVAPVEVKDPEIIFPQNPAEWLNEVLPEPQQEEVVEAEEIKQPKSFAQLADSLEKSQKGVWNGSTEYDILQYALQTLDRQKREFEQNQANMNADQIRNVRTSILIQERYTETAMKHYLTRKNDEKTARERAGKAENSNSRMRRTTVENAMRELQYHIRRDEKELGVPKNRDKMLENIAYEISWGVKQNPEDAEAQKFAKMATALEEKTKKGITLRDRLTGEMEIINSMNKYLVSHVRSFKKKDGYSFSMNEGADGKPIEPKSDEERCYKTVLAAYQKLGNHILETTAMLFPDELDQLKEKFRSNDNVFGTNMNLDVLPKEKTLKSFDEQNNLEELKRNLLKQQIYRREAHELRQASKQDVLEFSGDGIIPEEIDNYRYAPGRLEKDLMKSAYATMYANVQKEQEKPYNMVEFLNGKDAFRQEVKNFKDFDENFTKLMTGKFDLSGKDPMTLNENGWKNIDMSAERVNYAKDMAFGNTLYSALDSLNKELGKKAPDREKVGSSLRKLEELKNLSGKINSQKMYNVKIPQGENTKTLGDIEKTLTAKAAKIMKPAGPNAEAVMKPQ